jgi:RNA polymerase-associated protein
VSKLRIFARQAGDCHVLRIALAEKEIPCTITLLTKKLTDPELQWLNTHKDFPVLIDHHVVVFDTRIILEYIDEKYPAPPLMPIDPTARAHCRLLLNQISNLNKTDLAGLEDIVANKPFFLGKHYSLVDTCLTPFLSQNFKTSPQLFSKLPNLARYTESLTARGSFLLGTQ